MSASGPAPSCGVELPSTERVCDSFVLLPAMASGDTLGMLANSGRLGRHAWPPPGCLWPGTEVEFVPTGRRDTGIPRRAAESPATGPAPRSQPGPPCRRAGEHLLPASPQRPALTHPHDAFLSPRPACRVSPGSRGSSPRGAGMLSSILCGGGRVNVDEPVGGGDAFSPTESDITKRG